MSKNTLSVIFILACLAPSIACAITSTKTTTVNPPVALSPEDFTKKVTKMGQQSQDKLSQQLNAKLSQTPITPPPRPQPATDNTNANPNSNSATDVTQTPTSARSPASNTGTTTTTTTTNSNSPNTTSEYGSSSTPSDIAPVEPSANQAYTGFGAGSAPASNNNSSTTSSTPSTGGGWNIKY